jgi:hypothetical protein
VALLLSEHADLRSDQVVEVVRRTAKPLPSLAGKTVSGGMVDAAELLTFDPSGDIPGVPFPGQSGATVNGELTDSKIDVVYRLELAAGELLELDLTGPANADFDLHLFGPKATTVFSTDGLLASSEGLTSTETIEYRVLETGTYYVDVYAYSGTGPFSLTASWANRPGVYENNNAAVVFGQHFRTNANNASHSGSTIRQTHATLGDVSTRWAELSFYGSGVATSPSSTLPTAWSTCRSTVSPIRRSACTRPRRSTSSRCSR